MPDSIVYYLLANPDSLNLEYIKFEVGQYTKYDVTCFDKEKYLLEKFAIMS